VVDAHVGVGAAGGPNDEERHRESLHGRRAWQAKTPRASRAPRPAAPRMAAPRLRWQARPAATAAAAIVATTRSCAARAVTQ
jgi:hypothetical protein